MPLPHFCSAAAAPGPVSPAAALPTAFLQQLRRKAEERNPDEFYFAMEKARTADGVHVARSTEANKYSQVRAVLCCAVPCCAVLCCAVPCCAVSCREATKCSQVRGCSEAALAGWLLAGNG